MRTQYKIIGIIDSGNEKLLFGSSSCSCPVLPSLRIATSFEGELKLPMFFFSFSQFSFIRDLDIDN